jgi:DUF4097 and DUF4098 domain-containing protein YvlB
MRISGSLACVAMISASLCHPVIGAGAQKETEIVDRTVPFPANGMLRLKNFSGDVRISGTTGRDVVVHAVRVAERRQLDNIQLEIETSGTTVSIDANRKVPGYGDGRDTVVQTTFEIQVPASAQLQVDAFSSRLTVTDVAGSQRLKTFSGDIVVTGAGSAVSANTFDGRIEVDATRAGPEPDVRAETFSGEIALRVDAGARGSVDFESFSGSFDSDLPLTMRSSGRGRVAAQLPGGAAGGRVVMKTFSGDARLAR